MGEKHERFSLTLPADCGLLLQDDRASDKLSVTKAPVTRLQVSSAERPLIGCCLSNPHPSSPDVWSKNYQVCVFTNTTKNCILGGDEKKRVIHA